MHREEAADYCVLTPRAHVWPAYIYVWRKLSAELRVWLEFSLGARMPSLLHAGSFRKLTESLPTSPSSLLAAKPKERVLKNQKSFSDEHGRSVTGKTNMELQKELGSWKAEDFVTNKVEIPTHLTVGTRIEHTDRGLGTVVNLRSVFPPIVFVEYDAGDIHGQEPGLI